MDRAAVEALRRHFPVVDSYAYLNHAAIAPLPQPAVEAMSSLAATVATTGDRRWPERNERIEEVRRLTARLLGAAAHQVAFVANTSDALSVVAEGLDWRAGDNIVGAMPEYPSNVYPWMALAERGVEFRQVPERDGRIEAEEVVAAMDERTRVLALSWIEYASGFRNDLARLGAACRERGVLFVVDAIQGLGALALDVERDRVDLVASAAHKWLLGPEGVGVLYVSDRVLEQIRPSRHGWRSVRGLFDWGTFDLTYNRGALRFECGTLNAYGIHALGASLELLLEHGIEAVERRVLTLAARAARGLVERGFQPVAERRPGEESGIVAVTPPRRSAGELAEQLLSRGVVVAERLGRLRVSPHCYNTEEEIDRLLAALDEE